MAATGTGTGMEAEEEELSLALLAGGDGRLVFGVCVRFVSAWRSLFLLLALPGRYLEAFRGL